MIKQPLYLTAVLFLSLGVNSYAQSNKTLSLSQAWEQAYEQYPALIEKKAQILESQYLKTAGQNTFLPQFQVQLQNNYGTYAASQGAFFPLPGIFNVNGSNNGGNQPRAASSSFASILMNWTVFDFGRRNKKLEAASYAVKEASNRLNASRLQLQSRVSSSYVQVLYNQAKLNWSEQNAKRVSEILELSKSLSKAGLKPGADTLLAASSYLQTLAEQDDWTGKLSSSKIDLTEMVPTLTDNISATTDQFLNKPSNISTKQVNSLHPYLDVINDRVLQDRVQEQLASRDIFPSVSILGGLSNRGTGIGANGTVKGAWSAGFNNSASNYLFGIGLTWNIGKAYNSSIERKIAGQKLLATQSRYNLEALQLYTELRSVSLRISQQLKQVENTNKAIKDARTAYNLYVSRYENGLINLTELLQIQLLLQQSEKTNIEAFQQLWHSIITQVELSGDFTILSNQFK